MPAKQGRNEQKRRRPRAGGKWGDALRDRLRLLLEQRGDAQARFAEGCGVAPPRVTEWLSGEQLPSGESLRAIGEYTGVSLDWLLFGDGGDQPVMRGQDRPRGELATDIANSVAQAVSEATRAAGPGVPYVAREHLRVDGARVLAEAEARAAAEFLGWLRPEWQRVLARRAFTRSWDELRVAIGSALAQVPVSKREHLGGLTGRALLRLAKRTAAVSEQGAVPRAVALTEEGTLEVINTDREPINATDLIGPSSRTRRWTLRAIEEARKRGDPEELAEIEEIEREAMGGMQAHIDFMRGMESGLK